MKLTIIMVLAAGLSCLAWAGARVSEARHQRNQALGRFVHVRDLVEQARSLESQPVRVATGRRSQTGMVGQVTAVLAKAGLASSTMTSLTPDADQAVPQYPDQSSTQTSTGTSGSSGKVGEFRRQVTRLTLDPLTTRELGRFLAEWRSSYPEWTPTSIELIPMNASKSKADRPLRVNITIESVYLATETEEER